MKRSRGYTLVELVMAIVIMSIAFYALINVFISIAPLDINVSTMTIGTHLLNQEMEAVSIRKIANVVSVDATAFPSPYSNYNYGIIVDYVTTAEPDVATTETTGIKRVKVRVWGPKLYTLEAVTIIATDEVH
jgi:prepilin-type N-terminal cleavage/methylation domain-containing protein